MYRTITALHKKISQPNDFIISFQKDLDAFPTLQLLDCPTRQQHNNIQFSGPFRDRNIEHRQVTNIPAAKFPNLQDTEGLLPIATPMPSVATSTRYILIGLMLIFVFSTLNSTFTRFS